MVVCMQLTVPEELNITLTPREAALRLAIGLFVCEDATLGQAAQVAGIPQADFQMELGRRRIPIHYGMEDLEDDLKTVERLRNK